ncbi:MAG: hypothetical protein JXR49_15720 [Acidobacteria bacterium]|nr:hypothetical protein [Acidobacteriota bacterium]
MHNRNVGELDIHPDRRRFLMLKPHAAADETSESPQKLVVVLNGFKESHITLSARFSH